MRIERPLFVRLTACALVLFASQALAQTQASNTYIFPLFVDGTSGGISYQSVVRITKTSTANPLQCQFTQRNTSAGFTGVGGSTYTADVLDSGFSPPALTQLTLDQFLPFEILRTSGQSPLKTGYARLSCPGTVETQLQVSLYDSNRNKLAEATILPAVQGKSFRFILDTSDGTRLGFSLANDSPGAGQFVLVARDQFNNEVDRVYTWIDPWSQVSRFVDEMLALPAHFVGTIELVGISGGQNYAVGLQFTGSVFTTIKPLVAED